ncbi:MAG: FkbM family methyltransferase [Dehalococcoidales bacterium]
MSSGEFEYEYDLGKLQVVNPDKRTFPMFVAPRLASYFSENPYEDFTSDLLLSFLKDDTLFIDIGAHYGYYTLLVGTKNPKCKIISFEPVIETSEILRRNKELNQLKNVKVHNLALSNKNETRKFNITEASDCCGFYENPITRVSKVVDVQAATLDSLINKAPKVPVIVKIDTEGHEIHVLEGMEKLLRNTADISLIVEFNPKCLRKAGYNPSDLLEKILQFGFEIYFVNDTKREINKLAENNVEDWKNHVLEKTSIPGIKTYINILCVKNSVELNEILHDKISLKTKTLLINPDTPPFYQFGGASGFPIGLGYIAAVLEKDYDVSVIDVGAEGLNDDAIKKRIAEIEPKIVGITSDTLSFQRAIDIATIVKQIDKKITVVIGGAHANALPTYPLKYKCFDICVYGEGERTAVELWEKLDKGKSYKDVKGISFRRQEKIVVNPKRELIENLDELPFPARHLFPMDKYRGDDSLSVHPVYAIGTSRGCPYSCAFCSNNVAFGKKYRFRSTKNVVDEIDILINQYEAQGIYFREDLFTANKQRVMDICDEIVKRGLHFKWECESRVNTVDEELLRAMKNAGCELIWFGVESGSPRVLDLLNKQINHAQIRKAYDLCEKVGIKTGASLILGVPGETLEEIQKTIELAEELKPKCAWVGFVVFTAFPVSPLYEYVKQNKLYEKEVRHGILDVKTDEFDRSTLEETRKYAIDRINGKIIQDEPTTPAQKEQRLKLLSHLIEGQKVLEIGCGNGDLSIEVAKVGFDIVGVDISAPRVNQATDLAKKEKLAAKARFMVMDANSLDFPDNSFDSVLIPEVLEHFKDSRKILNEAVRVARNGGRIIVSVLDGLRVPFVGHLRVFFKDTLLTELGQYEEEITWHELPFKKWLICSFFVRKKKLAVTKGPAIDILMPTYNGRGTIGRAIKSIINQTYQNWSLIIVDDGGEDIRDIIEEFEDKRIRYIQAEHKGKSHALNVGIANSQGEYVGYLDDDDILYPIHFEVLVKAALSQKRDFVYTDWYEVSLDENYREIGREFELRQDVDPWMLITQNYINHKCILHSRSLLEKAGRYDEKLDVLIDWDMIRRLSFVSSPAHIWAVTSERLRYYSGAVMQNRISGLWTKDQDKARRSMEIITQKTMELTATTEELKKAVTYAMLHQSYYHSLEFNSVLQAKDSQIAGLNTDLETKNSQIAGLNSTLQTKDSQINSLDMQIQQMQRGVAMQLWRRYHKVVEKVLRTGTRRRYYYELGLSAIRIVLNEGWRSFWFKVKIRFKRNVA